jgi:hypothetical protein
MRNIIILLALVVLVSGVAVLARQYFWQEEVPQVQEEGKEQMEQVKSNFVFERKSTTGPWYDIYRGQETITGVYILWTGPNVHGGPKLGFEPSRESAKKLPSFVEGENNYRYIFQFSNQIEAQNQFGVSVDLYETEGVCEATGTATIIIDGFNHLRAEIGGLSSARFKEIIEMEPPTKKLCEGGVAQDETADDSTSLTTSWQTYRSEKYGFEFRYPPTWQTDELFSDNRFVQLQEVENGSVSAIAGGVEVIRTSTDPADFLKMVASGTRCPERAGSEFLGDTSNVYCLTGDEFETDIGAWKGAVQCSGSTWYFIEHPEVYNEPEEPPSFHDCPHQFWLDSGNLFLNVHFNYFQRLELDSHEMNFFRTFLSTFKFIE